MSKAFQKTLYRHENCTWHYTRLIWQEAGQSFDVRTALCGQVATSIGQEALLSGETKETALHRLVTGLQKAGYTENPNVDLLFLVQMIVISWLKVLMLQKSTLSQTR